MTAGRKPHDNNPVTAAAELAHSITMISEDKPISETNEDWIEHFLHGEEPPKGHVFNPVMGDVICERMAAGESMRQIAKTKGMPSRRTVGRWCDENPEFAREYGNAQKLRCEDLLDQTLEIIDDESKMFIQVENQDGTVKTVVAKDTLAYALSRCELRHQHVAKMQPRKWGKDGEGLIIAAPALEPPRNGDTAKNMGNVILLENHPLRNEIEAWQKIADEAKARK